MTNLKSSGAAESTAPVVGTGNAYLTITMTIKGIEMSFALTRAMLERDGSYNEAAILGALADAARDGHTDILGNVKGATVELNVGKGTTDVLEGKDGFTLDLATQKADSQARAEERRAKRNGRGTAATPVVAA